MSRKEILAVYRPIRKEIRRHLSAASKLINSEDLRRAAETLGLLEDHAIVADGDALDMLTDVALFTADSSGERIIHRYAAALTDRHERAFARRLARGVFSIWHVIGRHPYGGLVVEDALVSCKPKHLMDEALEKSAPPGTLVAMRLCDTGHFLAGFGIVVPVGGLATTILRQLSRTRRLTGLDSIIYVHAIHGMQIEESLLEGLLGEAAYEEPDLFAAA
jgi:hypothetical protein